MTNLNSVKLPRNKAYNWGVWWRNNHMTPRTMLVLAAIMVGLIVYVGNRWLAEVVVRLDVEDKHITMKAELGKLATMGMFTQTDIEEGTAGLKVKRLP